MIKPRILIADDEDIIIQLIKRVLTDKGYEVETAENGSVAVEKLKTNAFNLLVTDLKMPGLTGTDVLKQIKITNPYIEVILVTGYPTIEAAVEALKIGAFDFICKPFDINELVSTVERCLRKQAYAIDYVKATELRTLFEINRSVTSESNLDAYLGRILDSALSITRAKKGSLLMLDDHSRQLTVKAVRGNGDGAASAPAQLEVENTIPGRVIREGKPIVINSRESFDELMQSHPDMAPASLYTPPLASLPLRSQRTTFGVMNICEKESEEGFTEREYTLLAVLAGQGGVAIENFKLYNDLQAKIEMLEETIKKLHATQDQLIQTEKLASVGQLASGIAHEIRNPLGIIMSGLEFLKGTMKNDDPMTGESIEKMKNSILRANNIIIELLKFSRASKLELKAVDLCALIAEAAGLLEHQASLNAVEIQRQFPPLPVLIEADVTMLRQVFFNLFLNGIDAMPKGGRLSVCVTQEQSDGASWAGVNVSDTGTGIAPENLDRIFDPFFTTKEPGKGTGLGLSISHMILERHRGSIEVKSQVGTGTAFLIKLPVYAGQPAQQEEAWQK